jgi:hypothetical protein
MNVKLFGKEPALVAAFLSAILSLALGLGVVPGLTTSTAGLITAAGAAVFGAYAAFAVKQNLLPAIVAAFQALVAVGFGFGLDFLTPELTGLLTSVLVGALGLFLRTQATPVAGSPVAPEPVPVVDVTDVDTAEDDFQNDPPVGDSDVELPLA